ncbi:gamma-glutamyltransferase [Pokkaliibacter plantistimulans]|uniref:Gamma-glutamyltransferase n=1 Tax=Proteobacteria bacterium 228 TaxID=2083153 RepID=A0A2S5KVG5_9PROT|nr:gamma-glutamyltransferase [Pokkaliibacter plantistimulans]PPC78685.1 gamma-glutamyltransferase [Pokkaliibacter plantistimulans]
MTAPREMESSTQALTGKVAMTAPHYKATEVGLAVLQEGGSAIEAMVAAAATIAVVYPHMNSLGGDGFWLIQRPGEAPVAIDACGFSAALASNDFYTRQGLSAIPERGPLAAVTLGGTIGGWAKALEIDQHASLPLSRLLEPARALAADGITVTASLEAASRKTFDTLQTVPGFAPVYLPEGKVLQEGETLCNPKLAHFISLLAEQGLMSAYQGEIGATIAAELERLGSPLRVSDYQDYSAQVVTPLSVAISQGRLYNLPAPTQGLASLLILGVYDRVRAERSGARDWSEAEQVHHLVESTKQAFIVRDREVTDPGRLKCDWNALLDEPHLQQLAAQVDSDKALLWPHVAKHGDTIWMGALDQHGTMVSFIQSIYWEFGSGVVIEPYGLICNNRGVSFSLDASHANALGPRLKPFHTLNPAMAILNDGRRVVYGTMGGEGQPQTQAALFSRYLYEGYSLPEAIARGRWLLGRTWGETSFNLKLEADLDARVGNELRQRGHDIAVVPAQVEMMGHAGAIALMTDGSVEAATDPRSDGAALVV